MIRILNAFGHCVSYDTVVRHETSLAMLQMTEHSVIPQNMVIGKPTTLVFDNQDYAEETKGGGGQTHIAAGIAIQRASHEPSALHEKQVVG